MPRPVALLPWTSQWTVRAEGLIAALQSAAPGAFVAVHHIGSTAVPGLMAKPVIDLLGENGAAGRRYFTRDDPETGARGAHLHVYATGDPALAWRLAFRDRLRADPATAAAYEREKQRCAALHPDDSGAYAACKTAWTDGVAAEAVRGVMDRG